MASRNGGLADMVREKIVIGHRSGLEVDQSEARVEEVTFVFAYGSNLDSKRMLDRVPSAEAVGLAKLPLHVLRFHKRSSKDGTGKANAFLTESASDAVEGVVYRLDLSDLPKLDSVEGKGYGYDRHLMAFQVVVDGRTKMLEAWAYLADADFIDDSLRPAAWYVDHVLRGEREHGLSDQLIAELEALETHSGTLR